MPEIASIDLDFDAPDYQSILYTEFEPLLKNHPVFTTEKGGCYLVGYDDCARLLSDRTFTRKPESLSNPFFLTERELRPFERMISHWMVFMDSPDHERVRKSFAPFFTVKRSFFIEEEIETIVKQQLLSCQEKQAPDWVADYASPIPIKVIAYILGIPDTDIQQFERWSCQLATALDHCTEADLLEADWVAKSMRQYFEELLSNRTLLREDSLIGQMEKQGTDLSKDELLYSYAFLLWAGQETTKNLIASSAYLFAKHPNAWDLLKKSRADVPLALEEVLRFETPLQKVSRWTQEDAVFSGYKIPKGTLVTGLLGAAHRDTRIFSSPNILDIRRTPNRHLAFGKGGHHCLGAHLARMEAKVAVTQLLFEAHEIGVSQANWRDISSFRSLATLNLLVDWI